MRGPVAGLSAAAVLLAALAAAPVPATAAQTATGPVTVHGAPDEEPVGDGDLVVDGQGKARAILTADKISGGTSRIILATKSAGGSWGAQELASGRVSMPDVAVNAAGDLVAVWVTFNLGSPNWSEVWCYALPAGALAGTVGAITATDHLVYQPQVVVDPQGRATVAWVDDTIDPGSGNYSFEPDLRAVTRPVADPDPETSGDSICELHAGALVTNAGVGYVPSVNTPWLGVDGMGNVALAWQEQDDASPTPTRAIGTARQLAGTGVWSQHELVRVNQPAAVAVNDLAVNDVGAGTPGDTVIGWLSASASGTTARAAVRIGAGADAGQWSDAALSTSTQARTVAVGATPDGGTVAAFSTGSSSTSTVALRRRGPGGVSWAAAEILSASGRNTEPTVAVDGAGAVTVVWLGGAGGLASRHHDAGAASWDAAVAVPVRLGASYPQAVAAPAGEVTVVWPDFSAGEVSGATLTGSAPPPPPAPPVAAVGALAPYQRSGKIPVTWSGSGGSGPRTYDLRYRRAAPSGTFGAPVTWRSATSATSGVLVASPGTVCVSVRASAGGATGAWSAERCTSVPLDDRALVATPGWAKGKGSGYIAGTFRAATVPGRSLRTGVVKVRSIALVVRKGPGLGTAVVYLGATKVGVVKLAAAKAVKSAVVPVKTFAAVRSGVVRIVVASSKRAVVVDAVHLRR